MDARERRVFERVARRIGGRNVPAVATASTSTEAMSTRAIEFHTPVALGTESQRGAAMVEPPVVTSPFPAPGADDGDVVTPPDAGFEVMRVRSLEEMLTGIVELHVPMAESVMPKDAVSSPHQAGFSGIEGLVRSSPHASPPRLVQGDLPAERAVSPEEVPIQAASDREPFREAAEFLEGLLPVAEWQRGLAEAEAKASAVALLSQMSHHLAQSVEMARRSVEMGDMVGQLREELRRERERRAELEEQVAHQQDALREAREAIVYRDTAVANASREIGELQR